MAISCDDQSTAVALVSAGKLKLTSSWISTRSGGEFARFEVRLPSDGAFRFVVGGARVTVVKAGRRKIKTGTTVDIDVDYVNQQPAPNNRLGKFAFCAITKDTSGSDQEVVSMKSKFLP